MSNTDDSHIDRSKRSRIETDEYDSDYEEEDNEDRHPKRQAIHDPETKTPYFNTEESEKPRRKKKVAREDKQGESDGTLSLRSVVSTKDAGVIIGKAGRNVNEIREISTARVTISDMVQGAHERILTVYGSLHSISRAFGLIGERILSENTQSDDNKKIEKGTTSIKLLIPDSRMGNLIGKGGSVIKSIQEQSFARLNASEEPLPMSNERTVTIQGTSFSIEQAVYLIVEILMASAGKQAPIIQYIPTAMNNSKNSNNSNNSSNSNINNNSNNRQSYISMNRSAVMMGYGGMMPMGAIPMNMGQFYYPNNSIMYDGVVVNPRQAMPAMMNPQTQQIFIPNDMVGCIIGKRGSKINEIRQMSGSQIKIDDSQEDNGERLITVTGTPESNQVALYLLYSRLETEKSRLGIQ